MDALISTPELAAELTGERPPVLLDIRWQPTFLSVGRQPAAPSGREQYAAGHIPGAVFIDLDAELAGAPGPRGRHPLPDTAEFGAAMRRAGVGADRPVVVYDSGQGWAAARAWWLLRYMGHPSVRVLDGGFAAWRADGGELSTEVPSVPEGDFRPAPGALPLLDADGAAALARRGLLLDARAGDRYRGETEPIDPVAGHIPGAVSAPTGENVTGDGRFRPARELAGRFTALGASEDTELGVYCGSGVSAAHQVLALAVAGFEAALYVGSWSEWSADAGRPVATGALPG